MVRPREQRVLFLAGLCSAFLILSVVNSVLALEWNEVVVRGRLEPKKAPKSKLAILEFLFRSEIYRLDWFNLVQRGESSWASDRDVNGYTDLQVNLNWKSLRDSTGSKSPFVFDDNEFIAWVFGSWRSGEDLFAYQELMKDILSPLLDRRLRSLWRAMHRGKTSRMNDWGDFANHQITVPLFIDSRRVGPEGRKKSVELSWALENPKDRLHYFLRRLNILRDHLLFLDTVLKDWPSLCSVGTSDLLKEWSEISRELLAEYDWQALMKVLPTEDDTQLAQTLHDAYANPKFIQLVRFFNHVLLRLNTLHSLGTWAKNNRLKVFPKFLRADSPVLKVKGLNYLLVPGFKQFSFSLDASSNTLLLNAPNRRGKSTRLRAVDQALFFANIPLPVPAQAMSVTPMTASWSEPSRDDEPEDGESLGSVQVREVWRDFQELHESNDGSGFHRLLLADEIVPGTSSDLRNAFEMALLKFNARQGRSLQIVASHNLEMMFLLAEDNPEAILFATLGLDFKWMSGLHIVLDDRDAAFVEIMRDARMPEELIQLFQGNLPLCQRNLRAMIERHGVRRKG